MLRLRSSPHFLRLQLGGFISEFRFLCGTPSRIHRRKHSVLSLLQIISSSEKMAVEEQVEVCGWIYAVRRGNFASFLDLGDGNSTRRIQVIVERGLFQQIRTEASIGSAVSVSGTLAQSQGSRQEMEVKAESIQVLGARNHNKFPLKQKVEYSSNFLRRHVSARPKTRSFAAFLRMRSLATGIIHQFFQDRDFLLVHTPVITGNDSEGAGQHFTIHTPEEETSPSCSPSSSPRVPEGSFSEEEDPGFFGRDAYLTVSSQLHLEVLAGAFSRVYCLGPAFRAEKSLTRQHMAEFFMLEAELAFLDSLDVLLDLVEECIKFLARSLLEKCPEDVELLRTFYSKEQDGKCTAGIDLISGEKRFVRMSYDEAISILRNSRGGLEHGVDPDHGLYKEQEQYLVAHAGGIPVFVTEYPWHLKPFYMKLSQDNSKMMVENIASSFPEGILESWPAKLFFNMLGYMSLVIPICTFYKCLKIRGLLDKAEILGNRGNWFYRSIVSFYIGRKKGFEDFDNVRFGKAESPSRLGQSGGMGKVLLLVYCVCGLQGCYLMWGILQEKLMTKEYLLLLPLTNNVSYYATPTDNSHFGEKFKDSLFLVFLNRVVAFVLSFVYISLKKLPGQNSPFYKYFFAAFSNIMSDWFQYEALKFISFPSQVVGKASKPIPVMLMGRLVQGQRFNFRQYATAGLLSIGVSIFLVSQKSNTGRLMPESTSLSGLLLIVGYLGFDSFTSNWQSKLFKEYKMKPVQMMCGVTFFSILLTLMPLFEQGTFWDSLAFLINHEHFARDAALMSLSSAAGQLFVYFTIEQFGAVTFIIIMTIRQALSILLSCIIYGHNIQFLGIIGLTIVFMSLFLRMYCNRVAASSKK